MNASHILSIIISAVICYLVGSLNFSIIISKTLKKSDVRDSGSGNAGATNMVRTYGFGYGFLTFLLDFAKVAAAYGIVCLVFKGMFPEILKYRYFIKAIGSFVVLIGHIFPCFFGFKGGKGISVSSGMVFIMYPPAFFIGAVVFFIFVGITHYISFSSLLFAVVYSPLTAILFNRISKVDYGNSLGRARLFAFLIALVYSIVIIYLHRANIKRLVHGQENKFYIKKRPDPKGKK